MLVEKGGLEPPKALAIGFTDRPLCRSGHFSVDWLRRRDLNPRLQVMSLSRKPNSSTARHVIGNL